MISILARRSGVSARVYLQAGDMHCGTQAAIVSTVLGSCVAVCLWDPVRIAAGLNHYMLPTRAATHTGWAAGSTRFGDHAIESLVGGMRALGCRNIVAKVFGGAEVLPFAGSKTTVGWQNAELALALLGQCGIPVVAGHLGGPSGLSIELDTRTGEVWLQRIGQPTQVPPRRERALR